MRAAHQRTRDGLARQISACVVSIKGNVARMPLSGAVKMPSIPILPYFWINRTRPLSRILASPHPHKGLVTRLGELVLLLSSFDVRKAVPHEEEWKWWRHAGERISCNRLLLSSSPKLKVDLKPQSALSANSSTRISKVQCSLTWRLTLAGMFTNVRPLPQRWTRQYLVNSTRRVPLIKRIFIARKTPYGRIYIAGLGSRLSSKSLRYA